MSDLMIWILTLLISRVFFGFFFLLLFLFLDGDVPRAALNGDYISHFRFARVSSHLASFNARNKL